MAKILYADSDGKMAEIWSRALGQYGFETTHVSDSSRVLPLLGQARFDLLICDLWCKPVSARTLCESIRFSAEAELAKLPVLVIGPEELQSEEFKLIFKHDIYFILKYKSPEEWFQKITTILNAGCPS
jgi:DNA-binding response OmpR family regulator